MMSMEIVRVGLVVTPMPVLIVLLNGFSTVGSVLAAEDHHKAANDSSCGDTEVHLDPEMIASPFHSVSRNVSRNVSHGPELAAPYQQPLLEGRNGVVVLTQGGNGRNVFG